MRQTDQTTKYLRPEAQPASWEELSKDQQAALVKFVNLLSEAQGDLPPLGGERQGRLRRTSWLDQERTSRTVFIHGLRGMGKTTLLTTIVSAFDTPDYFAEGAGKTNTPTSTIDLKDLKSKINTLRSRLVWLEPLDMDPLPEPSNLLIAMLARIEEVAERQWSSKAPRHTRQRPQAFSDDQTSAFQILQQLKTNLAIAWEGNLQERRRTLDPDNYALEVMRVERARLQLNNALSGALDEIATAFFPEAHGDVHNPLFVFPIDDVDLNPVRCLDTLRLIRTINVPRLFFVVLGSLVSMEFVFRWKHTSEFGVAVRGDRLREELDRNASAIAATALRKLLPPGQRIRLSEMAIAEALNYRPLGAKGYPSKLKRLFENLEECHIRIRHMSHATTQKQAHPENERSTETKNLLSFLLFPLKPDITSDNTDRHEQPTDRRITVTADCPYTGSALFHTSPREVADFWFDYEEVVEDLKKQLEDPSEGKGALIIINHIAMQCKRCIDEDLFLTSHQKHLYRNAIRRNRVTGDWELDSDVISLAKTPFAPSITVSAGVGDGHKNELVEGDLFSLELRLRRHKGWRVCLSSYSEEEQIKVKIQPYAIALNKESDHRVSSNIAFPSLSPNTNAAIVLFQDLLTLTAPRQYSGRKSRVNRNFEPWAITEWQSKTSAATTVWVPWPTPAFFSHWGYDSFLYYWQTFIDALDIYSDEKARPELLEMRVYGWIDSAAAVLGLRRPFYESSLPPVELESGIHGRYCQRKVGRFMRQTKQVVQCKKA